jgi:predicted MFS family arabinose efflux permease
MIRPEGVYYKVHVAPKVDWSALRTRPSIWIALIIWFLWAFAPAAQTPLLNYTKDVLKLSTEDYGNIVAIQQASFFPTLILYAFLSRKFSLRTLLWVGTAIGVIQWIPIIFVHSQMGAILWAGVFIGLTGGIATGAYFDLVIRSCPKEFTGMGITLAIALVEVATRFGDLLGSWLYDVSGFFWCAIATTGVYALIFPLLLPIPKEITAPAEGTPTT